MDSAVVFFDCTISDEDKELLELMTLKNDYIVFYDCIEAGPDSLEHALCPESIYTGKWLYRNEDSTAISDEPSECDPTTNDIHDIDWILTDHSNSNEDDNISDISEKCDHYIHNNSEDDKDEDEVIHNSSRDDDYENGHTDDDDMHDRSSEISFTQHTRQLFVEHDHSKPVDDNVEEKEKKGRYYTLRLTTLDVAQTSSRNSLNEKESNSERANKCQWEEAKKDENIKTSCFQEDTYMASGINQINGSDNDKNNDNNEDAQEKQKENSLALRPIDRDKGCAKAGINTAEHYIFMKTNLNKDVGFIQEGERLGLSSTLHSNNDDEDDGSQHNSNDNMGADQADVMLWPQIRSSCSSKQINEKTEKCLGAASPTLVCMVTDKNKNASGNEGYASSGDDTDDGRAQSVLENINTVARLQKVVTDRKHLVTKVEVMLTWCIIQLLTMVLVFFLASACKCAFARLFPCDSNCTGTALWFSAKQKPAPTFWWW